MPPIPAFKVLILNKNCSQYFSLPKGRKSTDREHARGFSCNSFQLFWVHDLGIWTWWSHLLVKKLIWDLGGGVWRSHLCTLVPVSGSSTWAALACPELELCSGWRVVSRCVFLFLSAGSPCFRPCADWGWPLFRDGAPAVAVCTDTEICAHSGFLCLLLDSLGLWNLLLREGFSSFAPLISSGALFSADSWRGAAVDRLGAQPLVG